MEIVKEVPFEFIMETGGDGLWSDVIKKVQVTKIELDYDNEPFDEGGELYGELRVYFDTDTWEPNKDGLIYTDDQFMDDLKGCLEVAGLDDADISYSEQSLLTPGILKTGQKANYQVIKMATLKSILEAHPEWADITVVVDDGKQEGYWYIDEDWLSVHELDEDEEIDPNNPLPVLVFSGN